MCWRPRAISPSCMTTCSSFGAEPPADCQDWRIARTEDLGHGRLEIRELIESHELTDFLAGQWAGVAQVFQLRRTVSEHGKTRTEVVYGITSLPPIRASAGRLLMLVREHWAIENRLRLSARRDSARRSLSSAQGRRAPRSGDTQQFPLGSAGFPGDLQCP